MQTLLPIFVTILTVSVGTPTVKEKLKLSISWSGNLPCESIYSQYTQHDTLQHKHNLGCESIYGQYTLWSAQQGCIGGRTHRFFSIKQQTLRRPGLSVLCRWLFGIMTTIKRQQLVCLYLDNITLMIYRAAKWRPISMICVSLPTNRWKENRLNGFQLQVQMSNTSKY